MIYMRKIVLLSLLIIGGLFCAAEKTTDTIPAKLADVESVKVIIERLYEIISGSADQPRNWDRLRNLFLPGARMVATNRKPDGSYGHRSMTVEEYIQTSGPFLEKNGFFEKEIGRREEQYGGIVHVFSTYESRNKSTDEKPFMRGINSIQLLNEGKRWWIVSILWQNETPGNSIPEKYLD